MWRTLPLALRAVVRAGGTGGSGLASRSLLRPLLHNAVNPLRRVLASRMFSATAKPTAAPPPPPSGRVSAYDPLSIERKWQAQWAERVQPSTARASPVPDTSSRPHRPPTR